MWVLLHALVHQWDPPIDVLVQAPSGAHCTIVATCYDDDPTHRIQVAAFEMDGR